tara:strand:- start:964 stop:1284 length:321 start_codon:yes stop_codon:yes gene_type:complete
MKKLKIKTDTTLKYLQVFNGILELTYRELQVLAKLIDLGQTKDLCSVTNKKLVAGDMSIKDYNTLNNYVKRLKDKGAIKKTVDGYTLNPVLVKKNNVVIEIICKDE